VPCSGFYPNYFQKKGKPASCFPARPYKEVKAKSSLPKRCLAAKELAMKWFCMSALVAGMVLVGSEKAEAQSAINLSARLRAIGDAHVAAAREYQYWERLHQLNPLVYNARMLGNGPLPVHLVQLRLQAIRHYHEAMAIRQRRR